MPLLISGPGWVGTSHDRCAEFPCISCKASRNLTPADREIVDFYGVVHDQTVNLTPMGVQGGGAHVLRPSMIEWNATCDIYDVPKSRRAYLIEMARVVFDGVHGRLTVQGLHRIPDSDTRPPAAEDLDG